MSTSDSKFFPTVITIITHDLEKVHKEIVVDESTSLQM